jgi:hypothetical protein
VTNGDVTIDSRVFEAEDDTGEGAREDVLIADADDVAAATGALERAASRWWLIDGAGNDHVEGTRAYDAWQEAMIEGEISERAHGLKFVSNITHDARGPWLFIDAQSLIRPRMREAYLRVLREELDRAGVRQATVTVQDEDGY